MTERTIFTGQIAEVSEKRAFLTRVYGWMTAALAVSGLTAFLTAHNPALIKMLLGGGFIAVVGTCTRVGFIAHDTAYERLRCSFCIHRIFNLKRTDAFFCLSRLRKRRHYASLFYQRRHVRGNDRLRHEGKI